MSWLDDLFATGIETIQSSGVVLPQERTLNFTGAGVSLADDPTNARTTITIAGGGGGATYDTVLSVSGTVSASPSGTVNTLVSASGLTANGAVTLPATPTTGIRVGVLITDISGLSFDLVVAGNGNPIGTAAVSSYTVLGSGACVIFQYDGASWRVISISYPRYTPGDSNTAFQWLLNEPKGTTSWPNTGTAGTATMTSTAGAAFGTPKPRVGGALLDGSLDFHSAMIDTGPISIGQTSADLTISIALAMRTIPSFAAHVFGARWGASGTGWSAPFVSFDLGIDDNGYPFFALTQTSGSPTITQLGSTLPWAVFGTAQLCEIEATYVKSTGVMNLYLCGDLAATTTLTPGAGIDYSGTSPSYFIGGAPAGVTGQWMDGGLMLARIENVARSQKYLQTRYQQLFGRLPMSA